MIVWRQNGVVCGVDESESALGHYPSSAIQYKEMFSENFRCIQVVHDPREYSCRGNDSILKAHYFNLDEQMVQHCDLHIISYETPTFGSHHFFSTTSSSKWTGDPSIRPQWVDQLFQRNQNLDLDTVIVAINSAGAADRLFDRHLQGSYRQYPAMFKSKYGCHLIAAAIATFNTIFYALLQFFHSFLRLGSNYFVYVASVRMFSNSRKNIELRCSQLLFWPIFLKQAGFRSSSTVEHLEKAALRAHSIWSSVVVDVILGNVVGFIFFLHPEWISKWVLILASRITDDILRTGCAWLMGVPAGFKLNTELAGVLGIVSLNAIQIWSTLWSFTIGLCYYAIKFFALSGFFLGMTIPAAMLMDIMTVAAKHVSSLHWFMSLLYSHQIQALTALWRLFRGRKWNPLRQRLDSYNYTVEQHIVGALLFTPLLLLVPTTSVFYMFFTIMNTTIVFLCILIEVTIYVIHATPYNEIFLWLLKRKRFPVSVWIELICYRDTSSNTSFITSCNELGPACHNRTQESCVDRNQTTLLHSKLQSNTKTFKQLILPHYRKIFYGVHSQANHSSAYGILTGKRLPTLLGAALPSPMPWMVVSFKEYWMICYESVCSYLE
ncbi:hypothetical protein V2J09_014595 [Rumex salicifolius]